MEENEKKLKLAFRFHCNIRRDLLNCVKHTLGMQPRRFNTNHCSNEIWDRVIIQCSEPIQSNLNSL